MTDVQTYYEGSLVGIQPVTETARDWIDENVEADGWQWLGDILWIEARFAEDVINGMINEGIEVS